MTGKWRHWHNTACDEEKAQSDIDISYEISKKKLHFSYKGNKKAANRKGLLLKIGLFPISFMGCIYD